MISQAYAQSITVSEEPQVPAAAYEPSTLEMIVANPLFITVIMVVMFYFLLIRPQQKRFKEHAAMLSALQKGDKVVTGGGLVGKIDKIKDGEDEVVVDLGNGLKVTAMRATLQGKTAVPAKQASNDSAKDGKKSKS